jgi:hypothetical protein
MGKYIAFIFAVIVVGCGDTRNHPEDNKPQKNGGGIMLDNNKQAWRVCRLVYQEALDFRPLGSAFIVVYNSRSWLVSNSHVINKYMDDLNKIYYCPNGQKEVFPLRLARNDTLCDLAIFTIDADLKENDKIAESPNQGEELFSIGFPDSIGASPYARSVKGNVVKLIDAVIREGRFYQVTDSRAYPAFIVSGLDPSVGASGSPVFSKEGTIVGYIKGFDDNKNVICFSGKNIIETLKQLAHPAEPRSLRSHRPADAGR